MKKRNFGAASGVILGLVPALRAVAFGAMQVVFGLFGGGSEVGPLRDKAPKP